MLMVFRKTTEKRTDVLAIGGFPLTAMKVLIGLEEWH